MELTILSSDQFMVVGISKDGVCIPEEYLLGLGNSYEASVTGLFLLLERVSEIGLQGISSKHIRLVNHKEKIYEFRKGDLRLFFFHGAERVLVVCTSAIIKKTQKVDDREVSKAIEFKKQYQKSVIDGTIELIGDN